MFAKNKKLGKKDLLSFKWKAAPKEITKPTFSSTIFIFSANAPTIKVPPNECPTTIIFFLFNSLTFSIILTRSSYIKSSIP